MSVFAGLGSFMGRFCHISAPCGDNTVHGLVGWFQMNSLYCIVNRFAVSVLCGQMSNLLTRAPGIKPLCYHDSFIHSFVDSCVCM